MSALLLIKATVKDITQISPNRFARAPQNGRHPCPHSHQHNKHPPLHLQWQELSLLPLYQLYHVTDSGWEPTLSIGCQIQREKLRDRLQQHILSIVQTQAAPLSWRRNVRLVSGHQLPSCSFSTAALLTFWTRQFFVIGAATHCRIYPLDTSSMPNRCRNSKCSHILSNVPGGSGSVKLFLIKYHCLGISFPWKCEEKTVHHPLMETSEPVGKPLDLKFPDDFFGK